MALSADVVSELERILGGAGLVLTVEGRMVYECDMHTLYKGAPDAVALPSRTEQVQEIVRLCRVARVPIVPRGSGTGLIGGAMAPQGGVMVSLNRMASILEVDLPNRCATVQPGLINLWLSNAVRERGWFFAPDPSSQMVSSIGGNVSTNAGGPHCLKYGITTNHVLGLEVVTGSGDLVRLGGKTVDHPGYDLTGIAVGSEGTFGLVTAVTVRLTHLPEAVKTVLAAFRTVVEASETVSAIIASGMIPAALEMLDEVIITAINAGTGAGYPEGAGAVLLIELDGPRAEVEAQGERAAALCREGGALSVSVARDEAERALLWKGRKEAAGAVGRLTSIDIDPYAGRLVSRRPDLMPYWHPVTGDSRDVLPRLLPEWERVDLFINDSAAGRDLQARELELVLPWMADGGAVVTAQDFHGVMGPATERQGMGYRRFQERPLDHFYPGRVLGFAVDRRDADEETA